LVCAKRKIKNHASKKGGERHRWGGQTKRKEEFFRTGWITESLGKKKRNLQKPNLFPFF